MHEVMDRALRLMAEAVHRYEGTVNQFLGDGLMALFGAPVAWRITPFAASRRRWRSRKRLSGYSEQLKQDRGVELQLRLGLNTGLVVVGRIGDDLRMDYTAVGDTTHLASRMQSLAEPGTILIAEATHRLVEGYVRSEGLGPVAVKGGASRFSVYRVIGPPSRANAAGSECRTRPDRTGGPRTGTRRPARVRGAGQSGSRPVGGVVGESGVGKSRLLYEFRKSLEGSA
jgi:class 3 adenylate cyclase